jgi:hypothetical protein
LIGSLVPSVPWSCGSDYSSGYDECVSKKIIVTVAAEALKLIPVFIALAWTERINPDDEETLQKYDRLGHFPVWADRFDGNHAFGPTLTLKSGKSAVELTLSWRHVLAVVSESDGKKSLGFHAAMEEGSAFNKPYYALRKSSSKT